MKSSSNVVMKAQFVLEFNGAVETIDLCLQALVTLVVDWKSPIFKLNTAVNTFARPLDIQKLHLEAP